MSVIAKIYAHHVKHGTGTFETEAPSEIEMRIRRNDVLSKGLPYLVLEEFESTDAKKSVLGFAYANWFKPRPAYRFSAEDSIYLDPRAVAKGYGKALLQALINDAEDAGIRKLIAVIGDSENKASVGVHQSCGYEQVGILKSCGWKFGRWLDVVIMERSLGVGDKLAPN